MAWGLTGKPVVAFHGKSGGQNSGWSLTNDSVLVIVLPAVSATKARQPTLERPHIADSNSKSLNQGNPEPSDAPQLELTEKAHYIRHRMGRKMGEL